MTKQSKDTITVWSAIGMLLFGVILTASAFCISPVGQIHDSVLWTLGQCLIYAGGALGIANYARQSAKEAIHEYEEERERLRHKSESEEG